MYVYEIRICVNYEQDFDYVLIKDDEQAFNKIKKYVMDVIRDERRECSIRLERLREINHTCVARTELFLESLQNKLGDVSKYEFLSQFKKLELIDCTLYFDKVEVM